MSEIKSLDMCSFLICVRVMIMSSSKNYLYWHIYTTVRKTDSWWRVYRSGSSAWCSVMTQRAGVVGGRWDIHAHMADSLHCTAEKSNYIPIKIIFNHHSYSKHELISYSLDSFWNQFVSKVKLSLFKKARTRPNSSLTMNQQGKLEFLLVLRKH